MSKKKVSHRWSAFTNQELDTLQEAMYIVHKEFEGNSGEPGEPLYLEIEMELQHRQQQQQNG